jgi:hypothetical protein
VFNPSRFASAAALAKVATVSAMPSFVIATPRETMPEVFRRKLIK